jgi:hypothetical protein
MRGFQVTLDRQASRLGRRSDLDRLGIQPRLEGEVNQSAAFAVLYVTEMVHDFIFFIFSFPNGLRAVPYRVRVVRASKVLSRAAIETKSKKERTVMNPKLTNRLDQETADQKLIDGFSKHGATMASIVIDGTSYKTPDVITIVQGLVNSAKAVVSSRATWQTNVAADIDERTKQKTFMSGLRKSLLVAFGGSIDVLADFGLAPPKARTPLTPAQKQAAAAKGKATRAARHTMGAKQKAQITGATAASLPSGDATKVPATSPATPPPASPPAPVAVPVTTSHT